MTGTVGFIWCERPRKVDTRHVQRVLANGAIVVTDCETRHGVVF